MKYQEVSVKEEIAAPAEDVWQLIRDFSDINAWAVGNVVKVEGSGIGMIRHIEFSAGKIVESCEAHDDTQMSFSYRLLESPWPISNYVAIVKLTPAGTNKTIIQWSSVYQATPQEEDAARSLIETSYSKGFIARLRKTATQTEINE